jgi:uncharacterized membrane protein YtjA (UPF0391 family)
MKAAVAGEDGRMLYDAAMSFAVTLLAAMAGFGGALGTAVAVTKALAVIFLVLFFVALFQLLREEP